MYFPNLQAFETWFEGESKKVSLEKGATERGPFVTPTVRPDEPPWKVTWFIFFRNGKYIRLSESYYAKSLKSGGGAERAHFSFHYGPTPPKKFGHLGWQSDELFDLRVDSDPRIGPHIHFNGEDHVLQSRVKGLDIERQTMFTFIAAVQNHRTTGASLDSVLGFKVEAIP